MMLAIQSWQMNKNAVNKRNHALSVQAKKRALYYKIKITNQQQNKNIHFKYKKIHKTKEWNYKKLYTMNMSMHFWEKKWHISYHRYQAYKKSKNASTKIYIIR